MAAVNYYFGDKHRLYVEVMRYAHRGFAEHPLPQWPPQTPAAVKLRAFVEQMLSDMDEEPGPWWRRRLMMREMAEPTEACLAVMDAFIQPRRALLREILDEILPPDLPEWRSSWSRLALWGNVCFIGCIGRWSGGRRARRCSDRLTWRG